MAIDTAVRMSLTVLDELGTEAADTYYAQVDGAVATPASLLAQWASLAQLVDAVTGGQIIRGSVTIIADPTVVTSPALKTAPISGSRVEQTAIFNMTNVVTPHRYGQIVPALRDTLISAGKIVLTEGGAVDLLLDFLVTVSASFEWSNNNQQTLVALRDAVLSFRKRRKQLSRSSVEPGP